MSGGAGIEKIDLEKIDYLPGLANEKVLLRPTCLSTKPSI